MAELRQLHNAMQYSVMQCNVTLYCVAQHCTIYLANSSNILSTNLRELVSSATKPLVNAMRFESNNGNGEVNDLIVQIETEATKVFGSIEKARQWLESDNAALGCAPLLLLSSESGAKEVKKALLAISYGGVV